MENELLALTEELKKVREQLIRKTITREVAQTFANLVDVSINVITFMHRIK